MTVSKKITEELITEIKHHKKADKRLLSGEIVQLFDGVALVEGLEEAKNGEMVELGQGLVGMAIDLQEYQTAILLFDDYTKLRVGDRVVTSGKTLSIPIGKTMLGRVISPLGKALDGRSDPKIEAWQELERIAPGIIYRKGVSEPLQTGIKSVDALIPIGRGQRELIIGDRTTGKTTLAIDTILNQHDQNVICIYVAVGQKKAKIAQVVNLLTEKGAMEYTIVVPAFSADSASLQYIAPYAGTAIAEFFMKQGKDVLIIYDDLTKHAWAYRQISLILKRPAGREAYPGDVFYLHSRLLERACRMDKQYGGGSITALPIIETQEGDISAYIPTNVISITDGQIFLEKELFNAGMRPAINVGASVSRVGSSAQIKAMKQVAGKLKFELAQYRELAAFSQFASDLDEETKKTLDRGARMYELLKQAQNSPLPVAQQVVSLWLGIQGYLQDIALLDVPRFANEFITMLGASKGKVLQTIAKEKMVNEAVEKELHNYAQNFLTMFSKSNESQTT